MHDALLAEMPEGAKHDADICPFCTEKAAQQVSSHASVPSGSSPSGAVTNQPPHVEGGTPDMSTASVSDTLSRETHEALLEKALKDATQATESALERKNEEASALTAEKAEMTEKIAKLEADNADLNRKLDEAQVQLKAATDEVASLKADVAAKEEAARKSEVASTRAAQVKNLGLFTEEYVSEKASKWADLADEEWNERLDEWRNFNKPAEGSSAASADTASAMTGTSSELGTEPKVETASESKPSARRAVLGLTS